MDQTTEFMQIVRRHDRGLRALAYRLLRNREVLDDVLQEAYLKAFRGFSAFRGEAQASTWLYRIVYNCCLDHLRRERRSLEVLVDTVCDDRVSLDPADEVQSDEGLAKTLALLPVEQRAAVLLVDAIGLSYEQAAEVLSVPAGTVASRLNHARRALRMTLC